MIKVGDRVRYVPSSPDMEDYGLLGTVTRIGDADEGIAVYIKFDDGSDSGVNYFGNPKDDLIEIIEEAPV